MIWIIFIGTMALSLIAAARVKSKYAKFSKVPAMSGVTGAQAAARVLAGSGIRDVQVVAQDGMLSDHYDPIHKRLVLSSQNYHGASVAALGIAAHEAGHAIQHQKAYGPLHLRMAAVGATSFASQIVTWLPLIGIVTGLFATKVGFLIMAIGWGVIMLFNLVTLPVEFDASRRAKAVLGNTGMITSQDEANGVNEVLNAAAWTYVAAFITSLAYMLYYLLPLLTGRD